MTAAPTPWWSSIASGTPDQSAILAGRPDVASWVNGGGDFNAWLQGNGNSEAQQGQQQFAQTLANQANPASPVQSAPMAPPGVGTTNPDGSSNLWNWSQAMAPPSSAPNVQNADGTSSTADGWFSYDADGNIANGPMANRLLAETGHTVPDPNAAQPPPTTIDASMLGIGNRGLINPQQPNTFGDFGAPASQITAQPGLVAQASRPTGPAPSGTGFSY